MEAVNCFINNDPMAVVLISFMTGLLFSAVSWGLIYVLLFLIIWEILYYGYLNANDRAWGFDHRITVIMAALLGFLLGRFFHDDDDHFSSCSEFKDDVNKYGDDFAWFN